MATPQTAWRLLGWMASLGVLWSCGPGAPTYPLSAVTVRQSPAGPSGTSGLASVFVIEAELDLKATGLHQRVDSTTRVSYVEGRYGRVIPSKSLVTVDGDVARVNATVAEKDYHAAFGFQDFSPFLRIGLRTGTSEEVVTEGAIPQTPKPRGP